MTPGSFEDSARLLVDAGFTGWQAVVMGAIGYAESGLNPAARHLNDEKPDSPWYLTTDWSVWQINDNGDALTLFIVRGVITLRGSIGKQLSDPATNARCARSLFVSRGGPRDPIAGYNAWATFKSGAYAPFKAPALRAARAIGVAV